MNIVAVPQRLYRVNEIHVMENCPELLMSMDRVEKKHVSRPDPVQRICNSNEVTYGKAL